MNQNQFKGAETLLSRQEQNLPADALRALRLFVAAQIRKVAQRANGMV